MEHLEEKIILYKQKYGRVYKYMSSDGKSCILRCPSIKDIDACRTISGGSGLMFDQALLQNCWLEGDEELRTDDKYVLGIFDWLGMLIQKVEGEMGEL